VSPDAIFRALMAFDEAMHDKPHTLVTRYAAMRAALQTVKIASAMCETCFTEWPLMNAPAVCPVCAKGRA
jgi:rubrerythrin